MLNKHEAYEVIDRVLAYCNYYTMVTITSDETGLTRFANSEIHQNVFTADSVVKITIYDGKKKCEVTTNILDEEALKETVLQAEEKLQFMPDGEFEMPEIIDEEIAYEACDKELEKKFNITRRAELIKEGIGILEEGYTAAGALSLNKMALAIGNNRGTRRYGRVDYSSFNVVIMHEDGSTGCVQYDTKDADDLNVNKCFKMAYNKAKLGLNPQSIEPGSYTVILEPMAAGEILNYMNFTGFSARAIQLGMSYLTGKLGQKVFGENITIVDDVNNENLFPIYFDFEGIRRKPLNIIDKGVAKEVAYDIRTSIKDGVETTGHGIGDGGYPIHLVMNGGNDTLESLIKSTEKGVLVSKFHYMNIVDPRNAVLTGLTRDGFYLIEDGKIKCGLKNMRFTESMINAFNNVIGITSERKKVPGFFGVSYVPALKIENFHFTGKTE